MENIRCIIKVKARKHQKKDVKVENQDDEGFGFFQDENYGEEEFYEDFKRLRIDDQEELFEGSENFSKKQKNGENEVFEFKTLESVKEKAVQNENEKKCEEQQNLNKKVNWDEYDTEPSISEYYVCSSDKDRYKIDEIDYVKMLYGDKKQQIQKGNKKMEKKDQEKKKSQILLRHQIRRY